ncbi:EF-hand domain-containing protein [Sphingomonas sp.]|uniref:EF-hand domain-containing protein n=1 Tax=Sphingomonas sp. TaxID=28214 RepID=UPI001EB4618E|nr:EF-hand domain-containing protein [Sphingomonas sp.]MBX3594076.1 EF-hand domain-containing protein [Sphingomonas sp.]
MWRYLAGGVAALLMAGAGVFLFQSGAAPDPLPSAPPPARVQSGTDAAASEELPTIREAPSAPARSREQKRFDRYDKDRDEKITLAELTQPRRKAFAKLDRNGDGKLSFEEWSLRTIEKFDKADADRSGALNRAEFATTAPKRKAKTAPKCDCRPATARAAGDAEDD